MSLVGGGDQDLLQRQRRPIEAGIHQASCDMGLQVGVEGSKGSQQSPKFDQFWGKCQDDSRVKSP